jgi:hypothetical protein
VAAETVAGDSILLVLAWQGVGEAAYSVAGESILLVLVYWHGVGMLKQVWGAVCCAQACLLLLT